MKRAALTLWSILLLIGSAAFSTSAFAQYVQYGGGVSIAQANSQVLIDKKILNPQNNQFVDNLNIEQHTFLPDQDITFRIIVSNVTQAELRNINLTDRLPDVLNFVSTSFGNFDAKNKAINLTIDTLKAGESKTFEIKTKVKPMAELPNDVTCQTNVAKVTVTNISSEDNSSFCVSKQILGATSQLPSTGPIQTLPMMILSMLFLAIGFLMKRIIILERR